jgi:alpha/beta superfamily hydrolase
MNSTDLNIVAKQNNQEIYLIAYKHKEGVGFVVDLDKGIRYADDKVQSIRKKGFWFGIYCSENAAKRILEKVVELKAVEK